MVETQPELLAASLHAGGRYGACRDYWHGPASVPSALGRGRAIGHLTTSIDLVGPCLTAARELSASCILQTMLGQACIAATATPRPRRGRFRPRPGSARGRGDVPQQFSVLYGVWLSNSSDATRERHQTARRYSRPCRAATLTPSTVRSAPDLAGQLTNHWRVARRPRSSGASRCAIRPEQHSSTAFAFSRISECRRCRT